MSLKERFQEILGEARDACASTTDITQLGHEMAGTLAVKVAELERKLVASQLNAVILSEAIAEEWEDEFDRIVIETQTRFETRRKESIR